MTRKGQHMLANDSFHIAVLPGDGIGPEVTAPALEVLHRIEATTPGLRFRFTEAPAGAGYYCETGRSMPESTIKLCREADAILLGACGLPVVRYPDGTEVMPQVELRFIFDLYAGVRPARLVPGVPCPIVGGAERGIDLVLIRESTEGLFASMGKGLVSHDEARETLLITRKTSQRLFEFSFQLAERRKARGRPGKLALHRQGQCVQSLCLLPPDLRRMRAAPSNRHRRAVLRRRLRRHAGAPAMGLRCDGDGKHVWRYPLRSYRRPHWRNGHGAVGGYRRHACGISALSWHRPRHYGQGSCESDRHDPLGGHDARLAR